MPGGTKNSLCATLRRYDRRLVTPSPSPTTTKCRECRVEVRSDAAKCDRCGAPRPAEIDCRGAGFEWKSRGTWMGYPLVHVAFGCDAKGRARTARGVVAVGQRAIGFIACGIVAGGVVTIGVASFGVVSLGVVSIALGCAVGVNAIAPCAIGVTAIGIVAHGVEAIGWKASL